MCCALLLLRSIVVFRSVLDEVNGHKTALWSTYYGELNRTTGCGMRYISLRRRGGCFCLWLTYLFCATLKNKHQYYVEMIQTTSFQHILHYFLPISTTTSTTSTGLARLDFLLAYAAASSESLIAAFTSPIPQLTRACNKQGFLRLQLTSCRWTWSRLHL